MTNLSTYNKPTRWPWRNNPRMEQVRQFNFFICLLTFRWLQIILYLIRCAGKDLYKTYTCQCLKSKGLEKIREPTPTNPKPTKPNQYRIQTVFSPNLMIFVGSRMIVDAALNALRYHTDIQTTCNQQFVIERSCKHVWLKALLTWNRLKQVLS